MASGKRVVLLLGVALLVAQWPCVAASTAHKRHPKHHDQIYAYVDGQPEYCWTKAKDSPSCVAEKAANGSTSAQEEAEASAATLSPPMRAEEACAQAKAPNTNLCANNILMDRPLDHFATADYDSDAYCRSIGDTAGGSNEIELTCREEEFHAWTWGKAHVTTPRILKYCREIGQTAGGSYVMLKTCVEQEEAAGSKL